MWRHKQPMMRVFFSAILFLWSVSGALAQSAVTAVRVGAHEDKTRFVIVLTEAPRFRVFTLDEPYRVVIDLPELEWRPPPGALSEGAGLIAAMRFGLFAPGTSRVVLDVSSPIQVKSVFTMPPSAGQGHRLVVDIKAVSPREYTLRLPALSSKRIKQDNRTHRPTFSGPASAERFASPQYQAGAQCSILDFGLERQGVLLRAGVSTGSRWLPKS